MKKIHLYITILFVTGCLLSCNKAYLDRFPEDSPNSSTYYKSADELVLAVNAAYNNLSFIQQYVPFQMMLDATTDLAWFRANDDIQVIGLGQHTPNTGIINRIWANSYTGIARCNALLEHRSGRVADAAVNMTGTLKVEQRSRLVRRLEHKRRGQVNGDSARAGGRVGLTAGVQGQRVEMGIGVTGHGNLWVGWRG
jgi:hypothetical protein